MKKTILYITTIMAIILQFSNVAFGEETQLQTVYAPASVQNEIYEATQQETFEYYEILKHYEFEIVKESITPIHYVDILEFAETGVMTIKPVVNGKSPSAKDNAEGNEYVAKVITKDGDFAGNISIYMESGIAYCGFFTSAFDLDADNATTKLERYSLSCSYADHAKRIKNILGKDTFVPASDVKYVIIEYMGPFYFIQNGTEQVIIPIGYNDTSTSVKTDYVTTTAKIKEFADNMLERHNKYLEDKEKWEKEHPGEEYIIFGYNALEPFISRCSEVENIINIVEYLNTNDISESNNTSHLSEDTSGTSIENSTSDINSAEESNNFNKDINVTDEDSVLDDNNENSGDQNEKVMTSSKNNIKFIVLSCVAILLVGGIALASVIKTKKK